MSVQNLVLMSNFGRPLDGIVDALKVTNPDLSVFRVSCLNEFLEMTHHLKAEVLVADLHISEVHSGEMEDFLFTPTRGNAREDMLYLKGFIRRHYYEDLSLSRLSQVTSINRNYLCVLFREQAGESIRSYINRIRMEKAALFLVIHPQKMVRDIAKEVGYQNTSYFDRVFRDFYGLNPNEYRRKYTEDYVVCADDAGEECGCTRT